MDSEDSQTSVSSQESTNLKHSIPGSWHPKLTPYRLSFILTTASFGTVKAICTHYNQDVASITLEWISGVVVFILLFWLGLYESESYKFKSTKMSWLFHFDCIEWLLFSSSPRARTNNLTQAHSNSFLKVQKYLPITGYDILVSNVAIIFGSSKGALAYLGHESSFNALDWLWATVVTISLYILGLYVDSPRNVLHFHVLFRKDYGPFLGNAITSSSTFSALMLLYILGFGLPIRGIIYFSLQLQAAWSEPMHYGPAEPIGEQIKGVTLHTGTSFDRAHDISLRMLVLGGISACIILMFAALTIPSRFLSENISTWLAKRYPSRFKSAPWYQPGPEKSPFRVPGRMFLIGLLRKANNFASCPPY
ncbi:hypothetical protein BDQ12DRAFT_716910 [Crucibulum laeve]|uniref:Uncharacterized protein n=1 Tax=Crucibulum laeve TaxID=68775 RepID=A0A5C3LFV3_9AGAR|nr:hypothetical protein BDQ12DRAFT_716910 [Crucibulum laeve]